MSIAAETVYSADGRHGVHTIEQFQLASGVQIASLRLAYTVYGELNTERTNVLLVLPGTSNTRHGARGHIGPGLAFDTRRYFVVAVDAIGGGDSSQPGDLPCPREFPAYTVSDMVRAQRELVTQALDLDGAPLAAVAGASMGAFQALEWVIRYPEAARAAVLLVPAARASQLFRETVRQMRRIIELDAGWCGGDYRANPQRALRVAGYHYFPWTVTDDYLETTPPRILQADLHAVAENFGNWDAWSLIRRYEASSNFDAAQAYGGDLRTALARVSAKLLVLPCAQDRLLGLESARSLHQLTPGSDYVELNSPRGHLAWRPVPGSAETDRITKVVSSWLIDTLT